MGWIIDRIKERSSWNGLIIGGCALIVLLGLMPLTKIVVWGGLAWGVWNIIKAEHNHDDI